MAGPDLAALRALAAQDGGSAPLPQNIQDAATIVDLSEAPLLPSGGVPLEFDPDAAQFVSLFQDDLVVLTGNSELFVYRDFVRTMLENGGNEFQLPNGSTIHASGFLEQFALGDGLADALNDIDSRICESSTDRESAAAHLHDRLET